MITLFYSDVINNVFRHSSKSYGDLISMQLQLPGSLILNLPIRLQDRNSDIQMHSFKLMESDKEPFGTKI